MLQGEQPTRRATWPISSGSPSRGSAPAAVGWPLDAAGRLGYWVGQCCPRGGRINSNSSAAVGDGPIPDSLPLWRLPSIPALLGSPERARQCPAEEPRQLQVQPPHQSQEQPDH